MSDFELDPSVCGIKLCDKPSVALGLCINHYRRNKLYGSPLARKAHVGLFIGKSAEERFDLMVIRQDGCWGWKGATDKDGYPAFKGEFDGVKYNKAHRYSYARSYGEHPGSMLVMHSCDNPTCTNPDHLTLGTPQDNMRDKVAKGRMRVPKGENAGHALLTEPQVLAILADPRSYQEIAADYGVKASTIGSVKSRKSWSHLEAEVVKGNNRKGRRGISDKLNEQDIRDIRAGSEPLAVVAARYGISRQSVCDIRKRRSWKHVT